ncbi:hypothetical protein NTJ12_002364 [Flavobacterium psychrophilum]|nr:hypothetical protein [Flavobacterium psychrophilum]
MDNQKALEDIRDVFSIFHDGTIETWNGNQELLKLKIDCEYLAERIDKSYASFYVEFEKIETLEFNPWMNPINQPQTLFTNIVDIFQASLEILSAEIENGFVKITCNQHNLDFNYCGGTLLVNCKNVKVFDEKNNELTIDELDKICNEYWNDAKEQTEKSIIEKERK